MHFYSVIKEMVGMNIFLVLEIVLGRNIYVYLFSWFTFIF